MSPFTLVLAVLAQTLALAAIVWKNGRTDGVTAATLKAACDEIVELRKTRDQHVGLFAEVLTQLKYLNRASEEHERRIGRLEEA